MTWIVCTLVQAAVLAASRQSANELACAVSASSCPAGPTASVAVHLGSAGSVRHGAAGPARVTPRTWLWSRPSSSPTAPSGPKDADRTGVVPVGSGADVCQRRPPSCDQAASTAALAPVPD